jgi:hypothetical protein
MRRAAIGLLSAALACSPFRPLRSARPPASTTRAIVLPFTEIAGMIVLTVTIGDDPTPRRFVFDTERDSPVVTPAVADRLGARPRRVRYGGRFYGPLRNWTPIVELPAVRIGELALAGGQAEVADLDWLSAELCVAVDGVLALDYPLAYELDYVASVLRVARSLDLLPTREGGLELPSYLEFEAKSGTLLEKVDVATALPGAIALSGYHSASGQLELLGVTDYVQFHGSIGPAFVWPDRAVGGLELRGVDAAIQRDVFGLSLGVDVLRAFTIRGDGLMTRLYPNGRPLPRGLVGFGFDWHVDGGEARIGDISEGTKALGLWHGAKIVALDGEVIASLSAEALCRLRRDWKDGRDSVRVTVEVEREGEAPGLLDVEVRRRSLLADESRRR